MDASSGEQQWHLPSHAGNRGINRTLHIMGVVQFRNPTAGRMDFDSKKAAGKEAAGLGGHSGTTLQSSVTGLIPDTGSSEKSQPEPATRWPAAARATS
ncbi:hypothetical protein [Amycolatopsis iheyensis]|uniref:hypothetical protein n=1 Tax=Amycolatopsis iheyensis TaxID=2945988 RepID=UPI00355884CB